MFCRLVFFLESSPHTQFSKGWIGFVDHKRIKRSWQGALTPQTHSQRTHLTPTGLLMEGDYTFDDWSLSTTAIYRQQGYAWTEAAGQCWLSVTDEFSPSSEGIMPIAWFLAISFSLT